MTVQHKMFIFTTTYNFHYPKCRYFQVDNFVIKLCCSFHSTALGILMGEPLLQSIFRNTANAIGNLKERWLVDFFKRINFKKGRATAVSALARKLAVIVWNMITKGTAYKPPTPYLVLDEKRKLGLVKRIKKQINKFALTNEDLGLVTI